MPDERSGVDDELTWRIYSAAAETAPALVSEVLGLPEDGLILVEDLPETWQQELRAADCILSFSPLDLGYFLAGPKQRARARERHAAYRVHGVPA